MGSGELDNGDDSSGFESLSLSERIKGVGEILSCGFRRAFPKRTRYPKWEVPDMVGRADFRRQVASRPPAIQPPAPAIEVLPEFSCAAEGPEAPAEPEVEVEAEPELDIATGRGFPAGSESVVEVEPEIEVEPEVEAELESETAEPEPEWSPEPELEAEPDLGFEEEAPIEAEPEPVVEAVAEPEPAFEAVIEPESEPEMEAEPEPAFEAVAEPEPAFEAAIEPESEPELEAEPEPVFESVIESEPALEAVAEPEPALAAEPEAETEEDASDDDYYAIYPFERAVTCSMAVHRARPSPSRVFDWDEFPSEPEPAEEPEAAAEPEAEVVEPELATEPEPVIEPEAAEEPAAASAEAAPEAVPAPAALPELEDEPDFEDDFCGSDADDAPAAQPEEPAEAAPEAIEAEPRSEEPPRPAPMPRARSRPARVFDWDEYLWDDEAPDSSAGAEGAAEAEPAQEPAAPTDVVTGEGPAEAALGGTAGDAAEEAAACAMEGPEAPEGFASRAPEVIEIEIPSEEATPIDFTPFIERRAIDAAIETAVAECAVDLMQIIVPEAFIVHVPKLVDIEVPSEETTPVDFTPFIEEKRIIDDAIETIAAESAVDAMQTLVPEAFIVHVPKLVEIEVPAEETTPVDFTPFIEERKVIDDAIETIVAESAVDLMQTLVPEAFIIHVPKLVEIEVPAEEVTPVDFTPFIEEKRIIDDAIETIAAECAVDLMQTLVPEAFIIHVPKLVEIEVPTEDVTPVDFTPFIEERKVIDDAIETIAAECAVDVMQTLVPEAFIVHVPKLVDIEVPAEEVTPVDFTPFIEERKVIDDAVETIAAESAVDVMRTLVPEAFAAAPALLAAGEAPGLIGAPAPAPRISAAQEARLIDAAPEPARLPASEPAARLSAPEAAVPLPAPAAEPACVAAAEEQVSGVRFAFGFGAASAPCASGAAIRFSIGACEADGEMRIPSVPREAAFAASMQAECPLALDVRAHGPGARRNPFPFCLLYIHRHGSALMAMRRRC